MTITDGYYLCLNQIIITFDRILNLINEEELFAKIDS